METHYGLTEIEYSLMKLFWENDRQIPFAEVLQYCNEVLQYEWAQTTLHTYLTRMIKKGILGSSRTGYKKLYYAQISEQELSNSFANQFIKESFGGSIKNLLLTLTYNKKLSSQEAEELKKILDENTSEEYGEME